MPLSDVQERLMVQNWMRFHGMIHQESSKPELTGLISLVRRGPTDTVLREDMNFPVAIKTCIKVVTDWESLGTGHTDLESQGLRHPRYLHRGVSG